MLRNRGDGILLGPQRPNFIHFPSASTVWRVLCYPLVANDHRNCSVVVWLQGVYLMSG